MLKVIGTTLLAAIPLALVLGLGASSQRLVDRWWPTFPNERLSAASDGSVRLSDTLDDAKGRHPRVVTMKYVSLERVRDYQEADGAKTLSAQVPAGQAMWRLTIHFTADPQTVLGACVVQVRDAGRRPELLQLLRSLARDGRTAVVVEWGWPAAYDVGLARISTRGSSAPGVAAVTELLREAGWTR